MVFPLLFFALLYVTLSVVLGFNNPLPHSRAAFRSPPTLFANRPRSTHRKLANIFTKKIKISDSDNMTQLSHSSSSIPLAFLGFGVRTSKILFVLFGVGLVFNLLTKKNATEKDAPNWSHVVTSPDQEAELHAFSCRDCGYTIFPARGREGKVCFGH